MALPDDPYCYGFKTGGAALKGASVGMGELDGTATSATLGSTRWANPKSLADHFARHGADFGAASAADYARQASQFLKRGVSQGLPTKVSSDGTVRIYDANTNTFGSFNSVGEPKTFFKPTSPTYWDRQPGDLQ
jgi:pyocin large subunit-like protein